MNGGVPGEILPTPTRGIMPSIIQCVSCGRQLRLPEEYLGRKVKCPSCGTVFTAEAGLPPPAPALTPRQHEEEQERRRDEEPPPADYDDEPQEEDQEQEERPRRRKRRRSRSRDEAKSLVSGPAIMLMLAGGLGLLIALLNVLMMVSGKGLLFAPGQQRLGMPAQPAPNVGPGMPNPPFGNQPGQVQPGPEQAAFVVGTYVGATVAVIWGLLVLLGAISMMSLRSYALAMTGSIVALIPCNLCCVVGLPIGIWSLVVLGRSEVKSAFD
jgi:hypothetical protein